MISVPDVPNMSDELFIEHWNDWHKKDTHGHELAGEYAGIQWALDTFKVQHERMHFISSQEHIHDPAYDWNDDG